MKQQCYLAMIYFNWILYAGGEVFLLYKGMYILAVVWLLFMPLALAGYVRVFPKLSTLMGYGRVEDQPARDLKRVPTKVTLYTALGCPFCPLVKQRLEALREKMEFSLEEVDVTLKPGILKAKGIFAVPVIEAGDRRIAGNATSEQLAALIAVTPHPNYVENEALAS